MEDALFSDTDAITSEEELNERASFIVEPLPEAEAGVPEAEAEPSSAGSDSTSDTSSNSSSASDSSSDSSSNS